MWSSGITLGSVGLLRINNRNCSRWCCSSPLIGGIFAMPTYRWPELARTAYFLVQHPYFLPCAITGGLALVSFSIAYLGLKEVSTLLTLRHLRANCPVRLFLRKLDHNMMILKVATYQSLRRPRSVAVYPVSRVPKILARMKNHLFSITSLCEGTAQVNRMRMRMHPTR